MKRVVHMMKAFLILTLLLYSVLSQASWITNLAKIGKNADNAAAATKAAAGAKGAAATGIAVNELDDAARAAKLNLTHPVLPDQETILILNNHYPWATTRLSSCIANSTSLHNNSAHAYCVSQYQKCIDDKKIKTTTQTPNEICIAQTNKEIRNEKK